VLVALRIPVFDTVLNGTSVIGSIVGTRAELAEVFEGRSRSFVGFVVSMAWWTVQRSAALKDSKPSKAAPTMRGTAFMRSSW
jgi:D-arabinose 1-dehydrogenase-like Zn-dependent alcohol dehydrogenase